MLVFIVTAFSSALQVFATPCCQQYSCRHQLYYCRPPIYSVASRIERHAPQLRKENVLASISMPNLARTRQGYMPCISRMAYSCESFGQCAEYFLRGG